MKNATLSIMRMTVKSKIVYRMRMVMWAMTTILWVAVYPLVWIAVYDGQESIAGYSVEEILTYFVACMILDFLITSYVDDDLNTDIRDGEISNWLLKPISTVKVYFFYNFSVSLPMLVIACVVGSLILLLSPISFAFPENTTTWLLIGPMIVVGHIISFNLKFMLGCIAFWLEEISALQYAYALSASVLIGWVAPMAFLPEWFQAINNWLPFQYTLYVPVAIFLEKVDNTQILQWLAIALGWLLITSLARRAVYARAITHYNAVGR